uniref:Uncharacterized protein n=1 Tax=Anguilla anguilla TaxID=7936 RepID=A0A0E9TWZ2_ANGAN
MKQRSKNLNPCFYIIEVMLYIHTFNQQEHILDNLAKCRDDALCLPLSLFLHQKSHVITCLICMH